MRFQPQRLHWAAIQGAGVGLCLWPESLVLGAAPRLSPGGVLQWGCHASDGHMTLTGQ